MKKYQDLSLEIEAIYQASQMAFSSYAKKSGLTCFEGCGKCCFNKEVSASVLEMIPAALWIYQQPNALDFLEQLDDHLDSHCIFYEKNSADGFKGRCLNYPNRPSVCRSFGAAAVTDKNGAKILSVCKLIKEGKAYNFANADASSAPIIGEYAAKIAMLNLTLGQQVLPLNRALKEALHIIFLSDSYSQSEAENHL